MMKLTFVLLFCTSAFLSFSQELKFESGRTKHDVKPQLFAGLSEKFALTPTFLQDVMNLQVKQPVEVIVSSRLIVKGSVSSINNDVPGLTTIAIQSSETEGMVLSLSRLILPDQTIVYRGIIISKNHSDMLILDKDPVTGNYVWTKKQVSMMIAD